MPKWHYSGRVTTPINVPGVGSVVLTPRMRFEAPQSALSNLIRAKLVSRLPDDAEVTPLIAETATPAADQEQPAFTQVSEDAVVASADETQHGLPAGEGDESSVSGVQSRSSSRVDPAKEKAAKSRGSRSQ